MCPDTEFLQTFLVIDSICSKCQLIAVWMECWMNGLWNEFRNKLKTDGAKAKVHGQCGVCVCVDDYSNWSMAAIYSGQCRCRSARRTFDFNFLEENTFIFPLSGSEIYVNFGIFKLSKFLERFNFIRISFIYSSLCSSRAALSIIFWLRTDQISRLAADSAERSEPQKMAPLSLDPFQRCCDRTLHPIKFNSKESL